MAEAGGTTTHAGIEYQDSIAAIHLGRLLNPASDLQNQVLKVTIEATTHVDDIVVEFADGRTEFIQAKTKVQTSSKAWSKLWGDFSRQYQDAMFRANHDRLILWTEYAEKHQVIVRDICNRARTYDDSTDWRASLNNEQINLINTHISPHLSMGMDSENAQHRLLKCVEVRFLSQEDIENERVDFYMPAGSHKPLTLFRLLVFYALSHAKNRASFTASELRNALKNEHPDLVFDIPPNIKVLRMGISKMNAVLLQHPHQMGQSGIEIERAVVNDIVTWAIAPDDGEQKIGILLNHAGEGKTVVMRGVLTRLQAHDDVDTLALKADMQLSGITSPADLQEKLGLPCPIDTLVSSLANTNRVVVLIDQIDALSLSLTHAQTTLNFAITLIARLARIPNVRLIVSCRIFDHNTDPTLRKLKIDKLFSLPPLADVEIERVLSNYQVSLAKLSQSTVSLLRTPLHLDLFVQLLDNSANITDLHSLSTLQELYDRLWQQVIMQPPRRKNLAVIYAMVDYMWESKNIAIPETILYSADADREFEYSVDRLASQGIITNSGKNRTFLHQTFFDYCFARRFVEHGGNLLETLSESPQGLFERPLMLHVVEYLRGFDFQRYLSTVQHLLHDTSLRYHLRAHIRNWFGALPTPTAEEWSLAKDLMESDGAWLQTIAIMHGNPGWFPFLKPQINKSFVEDSDLIVDRVWMPYLHSIRTTHPNEIVELLNPNLDRSDKWNKRLVSFVRFTKHFTPSVMSLYEELFYRTTNDDWDHGFYELSKFAELYPHAVLRMLMSTFEQVYDYHVAQLAADRSRHQVSASNVFEPRNRRSGGASEVLQTLAKKLPLQFLEALIPWMSKMCALREPLSDPDKYFTHDPFAGRWYEDYEQDSIRMCLINSIVNAVKRIAVLHPTHFSNVTAELKSTNFLTFQYILIRIYREIPEHCASAALEFLLSDTRRLTLGDGDYYDSRQLISAIVPHLTLEQSMSLESTILAYQPFGSSWLSPQLSTLTRWRIEQYCLLYAYPSGSLSLIGNRRFEELQRKFRPLGFTPSDNPKTIISGVVDSPIPISIGQKMSIAQWLSAMQAYEGDFGWRELLKGGSRQLSNVLRKAISESPDRFIELVDKIPDEVDAPYISAVIYGFSESPAETEVVWDIIRRFTNTQLNAHQCAIARTVENRTDENIPNDLEALLHSWLSAGVLEDEVNWLKNSTPFNHFDGSINTVRGCAFHALIKHYINQNNDESIAKIWRLIDFVCHDSSPFLRSAALRYLPYMQRYDGEHAIELFDEIITETPEHFADVGSSQLIQNSLRHHLPNVAVFVQRMLKHDESSVRNSGARLAALAFLTHYESESSSISSDLLEAVIQGDAAMRKGAAFIFEDYSTSTSLRAICLEQLEQFLDDEDRDVRETIGYLFNNFQYDHFDAFREFINLLAISENHHFDDSFCEVMWKCGVNYPNWSLNIVSLMVEKPIADGVWRSGQEAFIRLVIQIYRNTTNSEVEKQAMDVFDVLTEKFGSSAVKILDEFDQR